MIYFFDGTEDGFFTAFLRGFSDDDAILSSTQTQLLLGEHSVFVPSSRVLAEKAKKRLTEFDSSFPHDFLLLFRNGRMDRDMIAFRYCRLLALEKRPVRKMLAHVAAREADDAIRQVAFEIHRFHGFIRFTESASGALYAPFSPDHDICDLLVPHFKARLPEYPFVLHDVGRKKAAVYDGKNVFVAPLGRTDVVISADEAEWQALWKRYYASVNIPERERLKQMRGYLPARYWKFMPEKQ